MIDSKALNDADMLMESKVRNMELYMFDQTRDVFQMYMPKIIEKSEKEGYNNFAEYAQFLVNKYEENLEPWEKRFLIEIEELREIETDIKALEK